MRFLVGLPAAGRRVLGREAEDILVRQLPAAVHASLLYVNVDGDAVTSHVLAAEDADSLRGMLDEAGLVACCGGWQHTSQKERGGGRGLWPEGFRSVHRRRCVGSSLCRTGVGWWGWGCRRV